MTQKWNLGDIVPADRGKKPERRPVAPHGLSARPSAQPPAQTPEEPQTRREPRIRRPKRKRRWLLPTLILLAAIGCGAIFALFFGGANVAVYPKTRTVTIDATLTARQSAAAGELPYEVLQLTAEGEALVSATGQEEVAEQASGSITVYNAFSQTPQRLITNTRFESSGGLIFRMAESVVVPGYTRAEDGTIRPGSITARIYASETGEEYNIPPGRLTIPGLADNAEQFKNIYGELNEPLTGGFEGLKYIVPEGELSTARSTLQERLRSELRARLASERPNGFLLFEPSIVFTYATISTTDAGNRQVAVREQAILKAPLFPEETFASYIAERSLAGYEGESLRIANPDALRFTYAEGTTPLAGNETTFNLSGSARLIWNYDPEALRRDLRGISKNGIPVVAEGYPAIDRIEAVVKPFWKNNFPEDIEKITITERLE